MLAMLAPAVVLHARRESRRRLAVNEAIHELRRPLQAIAMADPGLRHARVRESSIRLAAAALERLEREVNGLAAPPLPEVVPCEALLRSAVGRWRQRATAGGGELSLRWRGGAATVSGDRAELEQAVDNLIVKALEHGGPRVVVEGSVSRDRLRVAVADSGASTRPDPARESLRGDPISLAMERLSGRRRRGHGLAVVRRAAARHGGRFVLDRGSVGSTAVLELPLARRRPISVPPGPLR